MDTPFKIKEIARFFGMTPRMLRHYEKLGLLKPEYIDKHTGYRYYGTESYDTLAHISDFKYVGMGLDEIGRYLQGEISADDIALNFDKKIAMLMRKKALILKHRKKNQIYKISREPFQSCRCVEKRIEGKTLEDFILQTYIFFGEAIKKGVVMNADIGNFLEFKTPKFSLTNMDTTYRIILADKTSFPDEKIFKKCDVIRTIHYGKLADLSLAFEALKKYASKNCLEITGCPIVVNLEGSYRNANSFIISEAMLSVKNKKMSKKK